MSGIQEFLRPGSVPEAARMLRAAGRAPLAGGTFLGAHCPPRITGLVDLSRLGLSYIKPCNGGVAIGAMTPLDAIARAPRCGPLAICAAEAATEPLRHMITLGGNVMVPLRWSDMPLLLSVLDAQFILHGLRARTVSSTAMFAQVPASLLKRGELLIEVRLPALRAVRLARRKLVRNHGDIPALHVAVAFKLVRGKMRGVRVAFVAQRPLPQRLAACEQLLEGAAPCDVLFARAAAIACEQAGPLSDMRFSPAYLRDMLAVFIRRALEECTQ